MKNLQTPCLIVDHAKLIANCKTMQSRAASHGINLRLHVKTAKSVDIALLATAGRKSGITVSTLKEAEHFAANGFDDILYGVPISPSKLARAAALHETLEKGIILSLDSKETAQIVANFTIKRNKPLLIAIEIDCGYPRTGVKPDGDELKWIGKIIQQTDGLKFKGVFTHAGHSYFATCREEIKKIAVEERDAVVKAAKYLKDIGLACDMISVGSTPTMMFADDLSGVTEMRPGVYVFQDMDQAARGVCTLDDIALSVLTTVISHQKNPDRIIVDAGGLALSKDLGAGDRWPDAGYGYVVDAKTGQRCPDLSINKVSQEHGIILINEPAWFNKIPIGSLLRILPNHACFTAAAYDDYHVVEDSEVVAQWPRVNGW